jgi:alpha-glucoside transport system permease protein
VFTDPVMLSSSRNNLISLLIEPTVTLIIALTIAVLADRVKYAGLVKAVVFIPIATSFVAAEVIWKLIDDYQPSIRVQTGTLNARLRALIPGSDPVAWLINFPINDIALIFFGI